MQIVVDIPKDDFEKIKNISFVENTETMLHQSSEDRKGTMMLFRVMEAIKDGTPLPKCNECKYYEGVHKVQGHAPCSCHTIGGVMWDWYCSQFEADKESEE